jgi:hypothetical protein
MWGVDASLFQFHSQLTWAVFFLNADRTIYGRYGSRGATGTSGFRGNDKDVSLAGFKKAIEGALEIHAKYPQNKASLAGKTGSPLPWKTPELSPPAQRNRHQPAEAQGGKGCIHCHEVQDYEFLTARGAGQPVADRQLWTWPMPDALGLSLDVNERSTVAAVKAGSPAEKAGFKAADRIVAMEGQPLVSIADVQWVLHSAKEPGSVKCEVDRAGRKVDLTLSLAAGWRRGWSFSDNLSLGWVTRGHVAGMKTQEVPAAEKQQLGLAPNGLALRIVELTPDFVKERNQSPKQQGLQKGDVLVEVDGLKGAMSESEFLAYLCEKKRPGDKIAVTYVRSGKPQKVQLSVQ